MKERDVSMRMAITKKPSRGLWACIILALGMLNPCHALNRVFLLAGQSNMLGQGSNIALLPPYDTAQTDVNYWSAGAWVSLAPGFGQLSYNFGPEVAFGRAIKDALPGDNIYLIKLGVDGTSLFEKWKPVTGPQYIDFMNITRAALTNLNTTGISYVISGMIWMQGESDAYEREAASYETNLVNFIADMRAQFNTPEMPFIIARVLDYFGSDKIPLYQNRVQTDPTQSEVVRATQVAVAEATPYATWFDTDAFPVVDPISNPGHYNTQGQMDLGNAFAAAILAYIPLVKIDIVESTIVLSWNSTTGATYTVRRNGDLGLEPSSWSLVVGGIPASPPENAITIPLPAASAMFYIVERNAP